MNYHDQVLFPALTFFLIYRSLVEEMKDPIKLTMMIIVLIIMMMKLIKKNDNIIILFSTQLIFSILDA